MIRRHRRWVEFILRDVSLGGIIYFGRTYGVGVGALVWITATAAYVAGPVA